MTIVDTVADRFYGDRVKMAFAFAELLNQEALALQADGVDIVQFDEPAFNVYMDEAADWGVAALERAAQGLTLQDRRAHLLRLRHQGQPRLEGHAGRASGASTSRSSRRWRKSRIDQVSLECLHSHVPLELMALLDGKDVMVGVIDVASDVIETPEEVADTIGRALQYVPATA